MSPAGRVSVVVMDNSRLSGLTLGQYEIIRPIGHGGMAQVYLATQRSINRDVAIKVMSTRLVDNPTLVTRFRQEAAILAQLTHPNILPIYDFGQHGELLYIVMAYIAGGTLADRMRQPLDLTTTAGIVKQIADALAFAHQHQIVHRDLKPANILMVRPESPLISDFGIARLTEGQGVTRNGAIVGTAEYMSPEQGKGEAVDGRSDIYSLGVILFELLTGRVPYKADSEFALVYKHIYEPIPLPSTVRPGLPPAVDQVVLQALAKRMEDRFQTAGDLGNALALAVGADPPSAPPAAVLQPYTPIEPTATPESIPVEPPERPKPRLHLWSLLGAAITLAACLFLAAVAFVFAPINPSAAPAAATIPTATAVRSPAPSPSPGESKPAIFTHIGLLGYFTRQGDREIAMLLSAGGTPQRVLPDGDFSEPALSPDGSQILLTKVDGPNRTIVRVDIATGRVDPVTQGPARDGQAAWSPDGRSIAFVRVEGDKSNIFVLDEGNQPRRLSSPGGDDELPAWAPNGQQLAFVSHRGGLAELYVLNRDGGGVRQLTDRSADKMGDWRPAWSPDGKSIAYTASRGNNEIWIVSSDGANPRNLVPPAGKDDRDPVWTPDGEAVLFVSNRSGAYQIYCYWLSTGSLEVLTAAPGGAFHPTVSR